MLLLYLDSVSKQKTAYRETLLPSIPAGSSFDSILTIENERRSHLEPLLRPERSLWHVVAPGTLKRFVTLFLREFSIIFVVLGCHHYSDSDSPNPGTSPTRRSDIVLNVHDMRDVPACRLES